MTVQTKAARLGLKTVLGYIEKNTDENLLKVMDWADRIAGTGPDSYPGQRAAFRRVLEDPDHPMNLLIRTILNETDRGFLETSLENFFLNANLFGWKKQEECRKKYDCNIPWAILMDPTSACNLKCTGCWAAEYGNRLNLTAEEMDSVICQGKELGIHMYIYTGGEPMVRKQDILALCRKHADCEFLMFTNGTLIDEAFAEEMRRCGNLIPAISLEGNEKDTDSRRGKGTYRAVMKAMEILREKHLPFGVSCCYTSRNIESIASDVYFERLISLGARFAWYFHYMPVGNDAVPELMPNPEQREYMYHKIRQVRREKPIFVMDFQNDGEYVGGCIAGGRRYFHINANGDCDPCVFIHYSDANIREKTLLEVLRSPIFMAYREGQPFNRNHLRPCPMLENPDLLRRMVEETGAHSTDVTSPESADHLCRKCDSYAKAWQPTAEKLWIRSCMRKGVRPQ